MQVMGQKAAKRQRQSVRKADPALEPDLQLAAAAVPAAAAPASKAGSAANPGSATAMLTVHPASHQLDAVRKVDWYNNVLELNKTGGTAQIVREFISNSIDAGSSCIRFAPIPAEPAGFVVADDGHGMSRLPAKVPRLSQLSDYELHLSERL